MSIGTSVDWFSGGSSGSGSGAIKYIVDGDGDSLQDDALIGNDLLTIARNNELLTEFSGYPDFNFDPITGTISGFPVSADERIIITFKNPL